MSLGADPAGPQGVATGVDPFGQPCASPLFRVLALLVGGPMLWLPLDVARELLQTGSSLQLAAFDDGALLLSVSVIGLSFVWVGASGRMPRWLFSLFRRLA